LAVTDWRLRRWRLWFLALMNATLFLYTFDPYILPQILHYNKNYDEKKKKKKYTEKNGGGKKDTPTRYNQINSRMFRSFAQT